MISYLKKNKVLLSKIQKTMQKEAAVSRNPFYDIATFGGHNRRDAAKFRVKFNDAMLDTTMTFRFAQRANIKVIEEDSTIYIGHDLNSPVFIDTDENGNFDGMILNAFVETVFPWSLNNIPPKIQKIRDEIISKSYGDITRTMSCSDVLYNKAARDAVENSSIFNEFAEEVYNFAKFGDFELTLTKENWPRLKDRKICPIMVFDPVDGKFSYCNSSSAENYRQARSTDFYEGVAGNINGVVKLAVRSTYIHKFCTLEAKSPLVSYARIAYY